MPSIAVNRIPASGVSVIDIVVSLEHRGAVAHAAGGHVIIVAGHIHQAVEVLGIILTVEGGILVNPGEPNLAGAADDVL